jgi:glycosyltransferase involved in cell wall biosynthesis
VSFRVLHIIGGGKFGGIAPYVASLVHMARARGGEAAVLTTDPQVMAYFHERRIDTVQVEGILRPVHPPRDLLAVLRTLRYLRLHRYDVVHTHTSKGGIVGRMAARLARVPVIVHTTQGYAFSDYAGNALSRWLFLRMERMATRWCDVIIAANEADRLKAIEAGIVRAEKIVTIPNGLDIDEADAALAAVDRARVVRDLGLDPTRPIVGVMGRLVPQKGIDVFLDAVPSIAAAVPGAQFLIVGSGELDAELRARAAATAVAVHFAGHRTDWYAMLKAMNILVMPSRWEGLPITLLGAMAASLPVVATRIKGIVDVCGDDDVAMLVEPDRSGELAGAVVALLRDEEQAAALGRAARAHLEREFSDRVMTARTWAVYDAAATRKGLALR